MQTVKNITQSERKRVAFLLEVVGTVLAIENEVKTATCVLNLHTQIGTEVAHFKHGDATSDTFKQLRADAYGKAQALVSSDTYTPTGSNRTTVDGVVFPNGLVMTISGFSWDECRLASLWIGYEMGWIELEEVRSIANQQVETVAKFMRLFRYFTTLAKQSLAA